LFTERKKTKEVTIGNWKIGGGNLIRVQSMCNSKTKDANATIKQIHELEKAGCEIIRVALPDIVSVQALKDIKENISIPLVADIHFDYKLAITAAPYVDKLRINPGNIGNEKNIKKVAYAAKDYGLPIRIGVNSGSIAKKYAQSSRVEGMVSSALEQVNILHKYDFHKILVSLKSSSVIETIQANQLFAEKSDIPLHLGVTEAGPKFEGAIKSAMAMGHLLMNGVGDTIRVSLTTRDLADEVRAGFNILRYLGLREQGVEIISCPTCARTEIDLVSLVNEVKEKTMRITKPLTISVMGCIVNGPGEAKHSDIGITAGKGRGIIFKGDKIVRTVPEKDLCNALMQEIKELL